MPYVAFLLTDAVLAGLTVIASAHSVKKRRYIMANIKGVSPTAPIVTNEKGGKQSQTAYGFHLIDTDAILACRNIAIRRIAV